MLPISDWYDRLCASDTAMFDAALVETFSTFDQTIRHWRERPDMAELRAEKKDDVAQDVWAAFQKGVRRIATLMDTTEDMGKVAVATGILFDKFALMSGEATARTETRALVDGMNDHERELLRTILDGVTSEVEA